jgi:hypothetical protein
LVLRPAVLPRDIHLPKRPGSIVLFRTCVFLRDFFVESASPQTGGSFVQSSIRF